MSKRIEYSDGDSVRAAIHEVTDRIRAIVRNDLTVASAFDVRELCDAVLALLRVVGTFDDRDDGAQSNEADDGDADVDIDARDTQDRFARMVELVTPIVGPFLSHLQAAESDRRAAAEREDRHRRLLELVWAVKGAEGRTREILEEALARAAASSGVIWGFPADLSDDAFVSPEPAAPSPEATPAEPPAEPDPEPML